MGVAFARAGRIHCVANVVNDVDAVDSLNIVDALDIVNALNTEDAVDAAGIVIEKVAEKAFASVDYDAPNRISYPFLLVPVATVKKGYRTDSHIVMKDKTFSHNRRGEHQKPFVVVKTKTNKNYLSRLWVFRSRLDSTLC